MRCHGLESNKIYDYLEYIGQRAKRKDCMKDNFKIPVMKTINEASRISGLAKYRIRQIVLENKVKYVKAGKKYLINVDSLIEYLNNGETAALQELKEITNLKSKIRKVTV